MLILDLEIEHLARARQRGFERDAAVALLLRHAEAVARRYPEPEPAQCRELGWAARFLARLAPYA